MLPTKEFLFCLGIGLLVVFAVDTITFFITGDTTFLSVIAGWIALFQARGHFLKKIAEHNKDVLH